MKLLPIGTQALILSKLYYGVLSKQLEKLEVDRYYAVLFYLNTHNNCCQQEICNDLLIDKTAMVKVLDYLVKSDYVERKVNSKDRREHMVCLSKKGEKKAKKIAECFDTIDKTIFSDISKQHQTIFLETLIQMADNLKKLPANDLFFNYKKTGRKKKTTTTDKLEY